MEVILRADGDNVIGLGHLYRLKSLYDIFIQKRISCFFISKKNQQTEALSLKWNNCIKLVNFNSVEDELNYLRSFDSKKSIIICDGYNFNSFYQKKIKEYGFFFVYVDDLCKKNIFADIIINHSPHVVKENYQVKNKPKLLLGLDYLMLRKEFMFKDDFNIPEDSIFLNFGGSDPNNYSLKFLRILQKVGIDSKINLVIGPGYIHDIDLLKDISADFILNIYYSLDVKEMKKVMLSSRSFILPASNIMYEALKLGKRILGGYYVENQKKAYNHLVSKKIIQPLGDFSQINHKNFNNYYLKYLNEGTLNLNTIDVISKNNSLEKIYKIIKKEYLIFKK